MATADEQPATGLFATKPIDVLVAETEEKDTQLKRAVGALDLTALGLGAIIGTGIFVIIGEAITTSGPSIVLAFMIAGITCVFSALAFAELASSIPVSGSAYTYSYATLGELAAWIIGWDLILEYGVSIAAVAVGWGAYLNELLDSLLRAVAARLDRQPARRGGRQGQRPGRVPRARGRRRADDRRARVRPHEHDHGVLQARRAAAVPGARPHRVHRRQLLAVLRRGRGLRGHGDGGDADLLRLHRLRRGLDLQRGGQGAQARPAAGDHRLAADRDHALHPRRHRRHGRAAVRPAQGRGRAAGRGAERGRRHGLGREHHLLRRARRHHERRPHAALRAVAHPLRHEPRRADAEGHLEGEPDVAGAGPHHRDLRRAVRRARRLRAAEGDRPARQHRHAVRLRRRQPRRDHPAAHAARPAARLPRPARARGSRSSAPCSAST